MKDNIDLTENRIFRDSNSHIPSFYALWNLSISKFPWSIIEVEDGIGENPENEPVLTGSKEQIERKKNYIEEKSGKYCERCGALIYKYPWSLESSDNYGLCDRCNKILSIEYNRQYFPWLMK